MKTTIDIPEKLLREVMKLSRAETKREGVVAAMEEYTRRRHVEDLIAMLGKSDTFMTEAELMAMRQQE